jgi:hypothetical protein
VIAARANELIRGGNRRGQAGAVQRAPLRSAPTTSGRLCRRPAQRLDIDAIRPPASASAPTRSAGRAWTTGGDRRAPRTRPHRRQPRTVDPPGGS